MIELPLIFVAGILGTAHCLGMCGPLALSIGAGSPGWRSALGRQMIYNGGRLFTYAVLGAVAGYCGSRITAGLPAALNVPAILAIAAGLVLVYQGLKSLGLLPISVRPTGGAPCLAGGLVGTMFRQPGAIGALLAGVFTGLLPCGLLYGMLALAASAHSVPLGAATMVAFGLGTMPVMVLAGLSGRLATVAARRRLLAIASWCLVLTGAISTVRGTTLLRYSDPSSASCPLCAK